MILCIGRQPRCLAPSLGAAPAAADSSAAPPQAPGPRRIRACSSRQPRSAARSSCLYAQFCVGLYAVLVYSAVGLISDLID